MAYLGDLRVRCNDIKAKAESKIEEYKEKVHRAKLIEKQIQVRNTVYTVVGFKLNTYQLQGLEKYDPSIVMATILNLKHLQYKQYTQASV